MQGQAGKRTFEVEIIPPKHASDKIPADLQLFADKYKRVMDSGFTVCITDNAMGLLAFQGHECIEYLGLPVKPEQLSIHLNTFHSKADLVKLLDDCNAMGVRNFLIISGDGSDRLPKLQPHEVEAEGTASVTSVELLAWIKKHYPQFKLGVAFNPYEPPEDEFEKMERKIAAGASFIVTQPIIEKNAIVDELLEKYPDVPVIIEAWMSKKLHLLSDAVGYTIPEDTPFDPLTTLEQLLEIYPQCGFYLSILGFKTQYGRVEELAGITKGGDAQ
ncbi:MAG: methylenetetrahydrofolate reductase [Oscillospiraceae bacterium]|jgi:methylenetetrahydrofolate reductase (NADPH)|nr:methylenetetrahydrofolate reductase [Oscillospiraceae bacterium]